MKKKCELKCGNKLGLDPYAVYFENEDGTSEPIYVCDECAKLLGIISEKMEELLNDETL